MQRVEAISTATKGLDGATGVPGSRGRMRLAVLLVSLTAVIAQGAAASGASAGTSTEPPPGTLPYIQRDNQNILDAYGRQTAPGGQLQNPNYMLALTQSNIALEVQQLMQQVATPTRLALTPGNVFPGWNVGNPLREGWDGKRGLRVPVAYTNRYGALIRGDVFAPLPGARDPYTQKELKPPYPGVVITTGSIQGSERMYWWLAEDLAERGYVVLTYDVQGQGTSETLPHQNEEVNALPFCNPFAPPQPIEQYGCPGVPAQQESNFIYGTEDALDFFLSTPEAAYPNPSGSDAPVNDFNPLWKLFDRRPDGQTATPGRTTRIAIVGHSLGAGAISYVQGIDQRVAAAVALDKLSASGSPLQDQPVEPVVPALAVQSEYGFNVAPYWMQNGSSLQGQPGPPDQGPDPQREQKTGFDAWREAGVDSMLIVPRASTHLEYTDIPLVLPASRYGQDLTSVYVQAWLDRYLKHQSGAVQRLLADRFAYLEPTGQGLWQPVALQRAPRLSFYYCSGYAIHSPAGEPLASRDIGGVGGC